MISRASTAVVVGRGRAGAAFAEALDAIDWSVRHIAGSGEDRIEPTDADLVLLCVPDRAVGAVADRIEPTDALVAHVAGTLRLTVLGSHRRVASLHPLVSIPPPPLGATRITNGATFAIAASDRAGEDMLSDLVHRWNGVTVRVDDDHRTHYHAAAVVASNHLVGLLGQVERLAADAGVPFSAFLDLARGTLDNVAVVGPAAALTGPAARDDLATLTGHLDAIDASELEAYVALADQCRRLVGLDPLDVDTLTSTARHSRADEPRDSEEDQL